LQIIADSQFNKYIKLNTIVFNKQLNSFQFNGNKTETSSETQTSPSSRGFGQWSGEKRLSDMRLSPKVIEDIKSIWSDWHTRLIQRYAKFIDEHTGAH
jgi:hypothetical protein